MPEISIIVPVYKAEDFLGRAVKSVQAQSFSDYELILVEDGSPDQSGALCDALAKEDSRIRVLHKTNGGVSSARNLGMSEAKGKYFAFLDADDWFEPAFLETLHSALVQHQADSAACGHWKVFPEGGKEAEHAALPSGVYEKDAILEGIVHRLLGDRIGKGEELLNGFIWRFLFTADIIREKQLQFEGAYLEDELFLMEYFCHAQRLAVDDMPLYDYLQNPLSVTRRYLPTYLQTFSRFMELKSQVVERFSLASARPLWRENSNWAGLLIAVGNEYAKDNQKSFGEKCCAVKEMCQRSEMQEAMRAIQPQGLSRNKQIVADFLIKRRFFLLTLLYAVKNR